MSQIICPECKQSVSNTAEACPQCGFMVSHWLFLTQGLESLGNRLATEARTTHNSSKAVAFAEAASELTNEKLAQQDISELEEFLTRARQSIGMRHFMCPQCISVNIVELKQPSLWDSFWGGMKQGMVLGSVGVLTGTKVGVLYLSNGQAATHGCKDCNYLWRA